MFALVYAWVSEYDSTRVEVRREPGKGWSLLHHVRLSDQRSNSGHQIWQQALLPTKPSHGPKDLISLLFLSCQLEITLDGVLLLTSQQFHLIFVKISFQKHKVFQTMGECSAEVVVRKGGPIGSHPSARFNLECCGTVVCTLSFIL